MRWLWWIALSCVALASAYAATSHDAVARELIVYGDAPSEFAWLWTPEGSVDTPIVVLIHGGFWRVRLGDTSLMTPLADDLVARGWGVWNIEYGRTGESTGGWPHTFEHVGSAIDHLSVLARDRPIDLDRVAVVGHSAGGHLAVWSGGRGGLRPDDPGSEPIVDPLIVVGLAPVLDLEGSADRLLGRGAVIDLLGGVASEVPDRYRVAEAQRGSAEIVLVVGSDDDVVPIEYSSTHRLDAEVVHIPGADHFTLIDPTSASWNIVIDRLETAFGQATG